MPLPIPIVAPLPGVPPLPGGGTLLPVPILALADALLGGIGFGPQWGIFGQDGTPIIVADSVASIEYLRDYRISDYPQQAGTTSSTASFQSYNKVYVPFVAKIRFLLANSFTRVQFLSTMEATTASLDLVTVVTPEYSYPSANIVHYDYRRESFRGVTLVSADVWCEEVRITAPATITQSGNTPPAPTASGSLQDTQSPNGFSPVQTGGFMAQPATVTGATVDNPRVPLHNDFGISVTNGQGGVGTPSVPSDSNLSFTYVDPQPQ